MKTKLIFLFAIILVATIGCKREYDTAKPSFHDDNPQMYTVKYSFASNEKGTDTISGEIVNGQTLHFTNGGTLILTSTDSITWVVSPGQTYSNIDQIDPTLANNTSYSFYTYSGLGNLTFTVITGTPIIPDDGEIMRFISKNQTGSDYILQFRLFNQYPGGLIGQYLLVGSGFAGASWTPTTGAIAFTPGSNEDSLDVFLTVADNYTGIVKLCIVIGTNWFSPVYQGIPCIFFNSDNPSDLVFSFNFNGSAGGELTDFDGNVIVPGSGTPTSNLEDMMGDLGPTGKVKVHVDVPTNDYTFYVRNLPVGSTFYYKTHPTDGTVVPNGSWMTLTTSACSLDANYSQVTIGGSNIESYLFFQFGTPTDMQESTKFWNALLGCCTSMTP
jgi:hypothetical protein